MGSRDCAAVVMKPMLRDVVEELSFTRTLMDLSGKYPRIEDVKRAVDWSVAKDPQGFDRIPGLRDWYVLRTTPIGDTPSFRVLFRYSEEEEDTVYLAAIAEVPQEAETE